MRLGDKLKKNFARNLQILRTRNDLTQAKLVEVLNEKYQGFDIDLRRTSIVSYEAEGAMPKMDTLYCIADHFGKTIDQLISPTMDKPGLYQPWMTPERGSGPEMPAKEGRNSQVPAGDLPRKPIRASDDDLDALMTTCIDGILYRQFYVEFLKRLFQQLQASTHTAEEQEKIETLFYKTFLGCQISKSKYLQDLVDNMLEGAEYQVFMAFKEKDADLRMIAKGLEMSEREVVAIFNSAQTKIASILK